VWSVLALMSVSGAWTVGRRILAGMVLDVRARVGLGVCVRMSVSNAGMGVVREWVNIGANNNFWCWWESLMRMSWVCSDEEVVAVVVVDMM